MRLVRLSILAATLAVVAPLPVFAQTATAISCAPIKAFNPNTALPGRVVCPISVTTSNGSKYTGAIALSGTNASDFSLLGTSGLLLATFLPVGNYNVTLTAGLVSVSLAVPVSPVGQYPTGLSCAPVAPLTTATAIPNAVVCPIQVTTSDGNPFTGTVSIGTEQYTPYFAVSSSVLPSNLIIGSAGASATTYTPQIVANEAGGSFAAYITVPVTTAPPPPPPPLPTMTITVNSGVSPVPDNVVAGTVVDTLTAIDSGGSPVPSVTFSVNNANFTVSGANLQSAWVSPISQGSQTMTITAAAPGYQTATLPLTVQITAPCQ
jgi:hypothetical protein